MLIKYKSSVLTSAGFRGVEMLAKAKRVSEKRIKVIEVLEIDNESIRANMSRTGAKRQSFYGVGAASREEGKIKNLSACVIIG